MSEYYLFGARVDHIQTTLFRGSRQRQVVGGSRLLAEFGEEVKQEAEQLKAHVVVAAGGRFLIIFRSEKEAEDFGIFLATAFHLLMDSSLTVAPPIPYAAGRFQAANRAMQESLQRLKWERRVPLDTPHVPTTAYCQTSGSGLAAEHQALLPKEPRSLYLAAFARTMADAGAIREEMREAKQGKREAPDTVFLGQFLSHLPAEYRSWAWAHDVEGVARLDGQRSNVAYLIADANGMGKLFNACESDEELSSLSQALDRIIRQALMEPVVPLVTQLLDEATLSFPEETLPLLPLIQAGDDLFVLLPAYYALDVARRFCIGFQTQMRHESIIIELLKRTPQAAEEGRPDPTTEPLTPPTMSAAVVFCKSSYPYRQAHERGHALLEIAKKQAKEPTIPLELRSSTVAFEVIVDGAQQTPVAQRAAGVYWAARREEGEVPLPGHCLETLLEERQRLHTLPNRRLHALYELSSRPANQRAPDLAQLLARMAATERGTYDLTDPKRPSALLRDALERLTRPAHGSDPLAELLGVWRYAQALDHTLISYWQEEAEWA